MSLFREIFGRDVGVERIRRDAEGRGGMRRDMRRDRVDPQNTSKNGEFYVILTIGRGTWKDSEGCGEMRRIQVLKRLTSIYYSKIYIL